MLELTIKRVLLMPLLLLAASFVIFSMVYLAPGSPEATLLGGRHVSAEAYEQVREKYHLNDPFFEQYANWLGRFASGDFGDSITKKDTVANVVGPLIVPTLELTLLASLLIVVGGVALGMVSALRAGGPLDLGISLTVLVAAAVSPAIMGLVLISVFAIELGWLPALGLGEGGFDRFEHLILPAVALAASAVALVGRTTRTSMIRALNQEFVETARSRGLSSRSVLFKHAFRHALIPVVTISGLVAGYLLSGAVIVEYAFGLNGLGSLLVESVQSKDFAVVQAIALFLVFAFLVINLVVDLLYALIDPRVRLQARRAR
ncbi:MAG: ABC transporter permease [Actinobacteria bacterium]|nr:ABC transporter permease [Actinomycetota bacterium]